MAKASDVAKSMVINKLQEIYPQSAVIDKKLYINFSIEGEDVQLSVTLTAPKTKIDISGNAEVPTSPASSSLDVEQIKREAAEVFDFFKL